MSFNFGHGKIDLNIKTYGSNTNNNAVDAFKNMVYDDVIDFNIISYDNDVTYNGDFSFYQTTFNFELAYANACAHVSTTEFLTSIFNGYIDMKLEVGKVLVRTGASIIMLGVSLIEGAVWLAETFFDGAILCVGMIYTLPCLALDGLVYALTGDSSMPMTNALWTSEYGIVSIVGKDVTGTIFSNMDNTALNELAYSPTKRGGFLYNIGKNTAYWGTMALIPGGGGFTFGMTAFTSFSRYSGQGFNNLLSEANENGGKIELKDTLDVLGVAACKGVIDGFFSKLGDWALKGLKIGNLNWQGLNNIEFTKAFAKSHGFGIKTFLKASKSFASELFDSVVGVLTGEEWNYDFEPAFSEFVAVLCVENLFNINVRDSNGKDVTLVKYVNDIIDKKVDTVFGKFSISSNSSTNEGAIFAELNTNSSNNSSLIQSLDFASKKYLNTLVDQIYGTPKGLLKNEIKNNLFVSLDTSDFSDLLFDMISTNGLLSNIGV